jgi:Histidinol dehydrogenase
MNSLRVQAATLDTVASELQAASSLLDPVIEERTRDIVSQVKRDGDRALIELTQRFDHADISQLGLRVDEATMAAARNHVDPRLERAIEVSRANVAAFSERSKRQDWNHPNAQGATVGEKFDAFQRVGIYIPGGTAPLIPRRS